MRAIYGAVGGAVGAACMTVLRMAARRHGLIEKSVPQAAEEWLAARTTLGRSDHPTLHHLADQTMHVGYGAKRAPVPSRHRLPEAVIDRLAPMVFGVATSIGAEELTVQADRGPAPAGARHGTRVG